MPLKNSESRRQSCHFDGCRTLFVHALCDERAPTSRSWRRRRSLHAQQRKRQLTRQRLPLARILPERPNNTRVRQQRQYRRQARSPPASDSSSQVKGRPSQPPEPIRPNSTRCKRPLRRPLRDGRRPCPTSRTWRPRTVVSQGTRRRRRQPVRSRRHSGQPARLHPRRTLLRLPRMPPADLVRSRS